MDAIHALKCCKDSIATFLIVINVLAVFQFPLKKLFVRNRQRSPSHLCHLSDGLVVTNELNIFSSGKRIFTKTCQAFNEYLFANVNMRSQYETDILFGRLCSKTRLFHVQTFFKNLA